MHLLQVSLKLQGRVQLAWNPACDLRRRKAVGLALRSAGFACHRRSWSVTRARMHCSRLATRATLSISANGSPGHRALLLPGLHFAGASVGAVPPLIRLVRLVESCTFETT